MFLEKTDVLIVTLLLAKMKAWIYFSWKCKAVPLLFLLKIRIVITKFCIVVFVYLRLNVIVIM